MLDLSAVTDVTGSRVVLQPAGAPGDLRECFADAEDHPHVQTMLKMQWLRIDLGQPTARPLAAGPNVPPPTGPVVPAETETSVLPAARETATEAPLDAPAPDASLEAVEAPVEQRRNKTRR